MCNINPLIYLMIFVCTSIRVDAGRVWAALCVCKRHSCHSAPTSDATTIFQNKKKGRKRVNFIFHRSWATIVSQIGETLMRNALLILPFVCGRWVRCRPATMLFSMADVIQLPDIPAHNFGRPTMVDYWTKCPLTAVALQFANKKEIETIWRITNQVLHLSRKKAECRWRRVRRTINFINFEF